jgi:ribosomal protein L13E
MVLADSGESDSDKHEPKLGKIRITDEEKSLVFTTRKGTTRSRTGRGYSIKEVAGAFANFGLINQNVSKVRAFHIHVDHLRRSAHSENISQLTKILERYLPGNRAKNRGRKQSPTKEKAASQKTNK